MREATYPGYLVWLDWKEWTTRQANCLLVGIEPPEPTDHNAWAKIGYQDPHQRFIDETRDMWRSDLSEKTESAPATNNVLEGVLAKATDLSQLIQNEIRTGKLLGSPLTPAEWISWAKAKSIELPGGLRDAEESRRLNVAAKETTEEKAKRLARRKQELKAQGVKNFLQQISMEENLSPSWVKQLIKIGESKNR